MSSAGSLTVMPFSTSSRMRFQRAAGNEVGDFDPGKNLVIVFNRGQQFVQMLRAPRPTISSTGREGTKSARMTAPSVSIG